MSINFPFSCGETKTGSNLKQNLQPYLISNTITSHLPTVNLEKSQRGLQTLYLCV
jgi:hypothetical protein